MLAGLRSLDRVIAVRAAGGADGDDMNVIAGYERVVIGRSIDIEFFGCFFYV